MSYAGDVRFNHNTQMLEIYDGTRWFDYAGAAKDIHIPTEKEIALDDLFKGTEE